ncbi:hypothetical protein JTB14_033924 [Gonioctena quinquepunctata]|nr:hypothetical protein JTB14_033924 [Gonioctena quinquepunctata]
MLNEHECFLLSPPIDIVNQIINTGILINFRRIVLGSIMVHKHHPKTPVYFKSTAARRSEEVVHIANYISTIHPFSMVALYWEFFVVILYAISFFTTTVSTVERVEEMSGKMFYIRYTANIFLSIDLVKMFFTGYYDKERARTILQRKKIAKKYLKTYFIFDFGATLHIHVSIIRRIIPSTPAFKNIILITKICYGLRIIRLLRWIDAVELFLSYINIRSFVSRAVRSTFLYFMMWLWLYTLVFEMESMADKLLLGREESNYQGSFSRYFLSTTMLLLSINYGQRSIEYPYKIWLCVFFMFIGYCLQMFLYTQILQVWVKFSNAKNENEGLFQQFTEYLRYKDLPMSLKQKFFSFYQFKFQNQFYNEAHINRMVSKILKQEILVYVTKNHVQRVEFFKDLPDTVLAKLVSRLKSEIYLANDIILTAGVTGNCMFFIYFGTVAIYSPGGKEICHLEDGAHFGEIALIFNEPRVATVRAVTPCELFILNRSDFLDVLEPYPEIRDKITLLAQERLRTTGFFIDE